jgi:hypothetical protein
MQFVGKMKGGLFTRDFERWMTGALEVEHLSLEELCEGNLEGDFFTGDSGGCVKEGYGDRHLSP